MRIFACTLCVLIALGGVSTASGGVLFVLPIFLNAEPTYLRSGSASLAAIAADAAREGAGASVAILPAKAFGSSLEAGEITQETLDRAIPPGQELVISEVSVGELVHTLNESMILGSDDFPHISGLEVHALRVLDESGDYKGVVHSVTQADKTLATLVNSDITSPRYYLADDMLKVITVLENDGQESTCEPVGMDLQTAFTHYVTGTPDEALEQRAALRRVIIASDTVDTDLAVEELSEKIPSAVQVDLVEPVLLPDAIFYVLDGQEREFIAHIWDGPFPYALAVSGLLVGTAQSVSTQVDITQEVPAARKTANTFDDDTIFVDLRSNVTVPDGSLLTVNVGDIYDPETQLHVYYYEQNGDIVPLTTALVDAQSQVSFPVSPSSTYILNSQELDRSLFTAPTRSHPFTLGIAIILVLYTLWAIALLTRKHRARKQMQKEQ